MSETTVIQSSLRDKTGKESVKKIKSAGFIPGVVYGHHFPSIPIAINASELKKIYKAGQHDTGEYQLFKLLIEGADQKKDTMVMVKEIQTHPITDNILHVDFFAVNMEEKLVATVQIRLTGKAEGVKAGGILRQVLREIDVKSLPADIPPHFEIDITDLQIGDALHVSDLNTGENIQVMADPETQIVTVLAPTVQEEPKEGEEEEEQAEAVETDGKEPSAETKE